MKSDHRVGTKQEVLHKHAYRERMLCNEGPASSVLLAQARQVPTTASTISVVCQTHPYL